MAHLIEGDAKLLSDIRLTLSDSQQSAADAMIRLNRIMKWATLRTSGLFFLVYCIGQFLFMWDVHVLRWLESWKRRHAGDVAGWFSAIGSWESLSSLSQLAHDHPDWCWPELTRSDEPKMFVAERLGHPLIERQSRVANDVQLGPTGTVLLVTGSNMSGKSTLLRSMGINITLAQAGSAVCATSMQLPPVQIETSMRISDSLASGVSFFMAELKRLKEIVDLADQFSRDHSRTLLYLLDEILQGTNSTERHIAVQRVLKHLLAAEAIGAISTHDLDLANAEGIKQAMQPVHFRESFHDTPSGKEMTFDYKMRKGVATTTNALKLLELVGLDAPE
jgi:DNA mismatch repair ATPase MutS